MLSDHSITRHKHFLSNNGDFWLFWKFLETNVPFLSGNTVGHTSVLPDRSVTRHEHFLLNNGNFWLFLKIFYKKEPFLFGNAARTPCLKSTI